MLTKAFLKIVRPLGVQALTRWVRDVAEGDHGATLQRLYWKLTGGKTWIGFALGCLSVSAILLGLDERVGYGLAGLGTFLVSVGLTDKAWRSWRPEALTNSTIYRVLAAAPVEVAGAFTAAYAWTASTCAWPDPWCGVAQVAVLLCAAVAIQIGLLDAAWRSPAPQISWSRSARLKEEPLFGGSKS
jgi:hypothetical protein